MNRAQRNRAARLARRVEVDGRLVAPLPEERHGTRSGYVNWGCQCEPCMEANSAYSRLMHPYLNRLSGWQRAQLRQDGAA